MLEVAASSLLFQNLGFWFHRGTSKNPLLANPKHLQTTWNIILKKIELNWLKQLKENTTARVERRHRKGQLVWHFSCRHLERTPVRIDSRLQCKFLLSKPIEWEQSRDSLDNWQNQTPIRLSTGAVMLQPLKRQRSLAIQWRFPMQTTEQPHNSCHTVRYFHSLRIPLWTNWRRCVTANRTHYTSNTINGTQSANNLCYYQPILNQRKQWQFIRPTFKGISNTAPPTGNFKTNSVLHWSFRADSGQLGSATKILHSNASMFRHFIILHK